MEITKKILWTLSGFVIFLVFLGSVFQSTPTKPEIKNDIPAEFSEDIPASLSEEVSDSEITLLVLEKQPESIIAVESAEAVEIKTEPQENASQNKVTYSVTSVTDGDTIKVNINGTIETLRIIGLDTPETVDPRKPVQCFGQEASNKAKELLTGKMVTLESDSSQGDRDIYGRLLRYVFLPDGTDFGKYMIGHGYAHEYTYNTPYKYQSEYKNVQANAKANNLGLWSPETCNGNTVYDVSESVNQSGGKFYVSSYHTAKYYYPESCNGWKSLSPNYLMFYDTVEDLLKVHPGKTENPNC